MNREETKRAIEVMQAYADGAEVQWRRSGWTGPWRDDLAGPDGTPGWNWHESEYRAKPKAREWWLDPISGLVCRYAAEGFVRVKEVMDDE